MGVHRKCTYTMPKYLSSGIFTYLWQPNDPREKLKVDKCKWIDITFLFFFCWSENVGKQIVIQQIELLESRKLNSYFELDMI